MTAIKLGTLPVNVHTPPIVLLYGIASVMALDKLCSSFYKANYGNYFKSKSNLHHTRGIMTKRVTSGGAHLRAWATQLQRNVGAVAAVYDTKSNSTSPGGKNRTLGPLR